MSKTDPLLSSAEVCASYAAPSSLCLLAKAYPEPAKLIEAASEAKYYFEALGFLAHALPKPQALYWALSQCQSMDSATQTLIKQVVGALIQEAEPLSLSETKQLLEQLEDSLQSAAALDFESFLQQPLVAFLPQPTRAQQLQAAQTKVFAALTQQAKAARPGSLLGALLSAAETTVHAWQEQTDATPSAAQTVITVLGMGLSQADDFIATWRTMLNFGLALLQGGHQSEMDACLQEFNHASGR